MTRYASDDVAAFSSRPERHFARLASDNRHHNCVRRRPTTRRACNTLHDNDLRLELTVEFSASFRYIPAVKIRAFFCPSNPPK
jgi:hypothetical protein